MKKDVSSFCGLFSNNKALIYVMKCKKSKFSFNISWLLQSTASVPERASSCGEVRIGFICNQLLHGFQMKCGDPTCF